MTEQTFSRVGPPGCGKTTRLARDAQRAATKYGGDLVAICSLTRTAAHEIRERTGGFIPKDNAGTLHSMCYRALDRPEIAETKIEEWNEEHPALRISTMRGADDMDEVDHAPDDADGDAVLAAMNLLRQRREPRERWPTEIESFAVKWFDWLEQTERVDFTGMIERALEDVYTAPGAPLTLLCDEAQDYSALEIALTRKWAAACELSVWAHDPWQQIFDWRGADVSWLTSLPDDQQRPLKQSYRVPRAVHATAMRWMEDYGPPIEYNPRDADGVTSHLDATWKGPEDLLPDLERCLAEGKTAMILATCDYMLKPLLAVLRREGIPFHNPYRRRHGGWNPLLRRKGTSSVERVLAYTRPSAAWSLDDVKAWADPLRSKEVLAPGAKKRLDAASGSLTWSFFADLFASPDVSTKAAEQDLAWYLESVLAAKRRPMEFPAEIIRRRGRDELDKTPSVIAGTVHSCKGGEADEVFVFPDLSRAAMWQWMGEPEEHRSVQRVFYVAMTRAREALHLCSPVGFSVEWPS